MEGQAFFPHSVFKDRLSLGAIWAPRYFTFAQNKAPIGLWVRGGLPHLWLNVLSQETFGVSVREVTAPCDLNTQIIALL